MTRTLLYAKLIDGKSEAFAQQSAMQLQQQQQQQQQALVAQQQGQTHHGGPDGPGQHLHRPGSVSSVGSESGVSKPHQCQQCLKAFSSNHQLVQHIRVHTGEKPYKCSYCDHRFKQLSHVQQHTRLHTGERPYKCHVHDCGRAFIQLSNLQQHLRNHDAQLERSKNRPFHCNICGKGFGTESSLRTHTSKQHAAPIRGPNAVTCPICHKLFLGGEALMEHMKHTHKDPNASGVATKRRTANHPCPICGKHYVNEGSLRKHLTCHPETAQLTTSLRMWPCSVCQAVFTHESGLLTHMEQMRMDLKHQFAAQYVLSRAAAERRERENVLTAAGISAMAQAGGHPFGNLSQGQSLGSLLPLPPSPSGSESSGHLSFPLDTNPSGHPHPTALQHTRMSLPSPVNSPLDARITNNSTNTPNNNNTSPGTTNPTNANNNNNSTVEPSSGQNPGNLGRKDYVNAMEKYEAYDKMTGHHHGEKTNISSVLSGMRVDPHLHHPQHSGPALLNAAENGPSGKYQAAEQAAMKMAAMLGHGHGGGHGHSQADLRNLIHDHSFQGSGGGQMHGQEMAEALIRTQAAEALRLAVVGNMDRSSVNASGGLGSNGTNGNMNSLVESLGNHLAQQQQQQLQLQVQQHQHQQLQQHSDLHRGNPMSNGHNGSSHHSMHHHGGTLNHHQLNSLLSQQTDLSEALLRLDPRTLGFHIPAHNF